MLTLKCETTNPHVFVTARCSYLSLVQDGPAEVEIVRVVLAAPDGSPSERVVALRSFIANIGVEPLQRLTERFMAEARRLMRAPSEAVEGGNTAEVEAELQHCRNKLFAALGLPVSWRKDFP